MVKRTLDSTFRALAGGAGGARMSLYPTFLGLITSHNSSNYDIMGWALVHYTRLVRDAPNFPAVDADQDVPWDATLESLRTNPYEGAPPAALRSFLDALKAHYRARCVRTSPA